MSDDGHSVYVYETNVRAFVEEVFDEYDLCGDIYEDIEAILEANIQDTYRDYDDGNGEILWKDDGRPITDEDTDKLKRIVYSTRTLPQASGDYIWDGYNSLLNGVLKDIFVPMFEEVFDAHTYCVEGNKNFSSAGRYHWKDNGQRVTTFDYDQKKFFDYATPYSQALLKEWKNRTGRFAPRK